MQRNRKRPSLRGHLIARLASGLSLAKVAALVTSITAVVGLLFLLQPDLKPQSVEELSANLTDLVIERHVTLREYRRRFPVGVEDGAEDDRQVGHVVRFKAEIKGFKGKTCQVKWAIYDASSKARLDDDPIGIDFSPEAVTDRASWATWIPARQGSVFVRLELYDHKNVMLTWADTEVFDAAGPTGT